MRRIWRLGGLVLRVCEFFLLLVFLFVEQLEDSLILDHGHLQFLAFHGDLFQ